MESSWRKILIVGSGLLALISLGLTFSDCNASASRRVHYPHLKRVFIKSHRRAHSKAHRRISYKRKSIKNRKRIVHKKSYKSRKAISYARSQKSIMYPGDTVTKGVWGANSKSGLHYETDNHGDFEIVSGGNTPRDNYDYGDNVPQDLMDNNKIKHIQVDYGVGRHIENMENMFEFWPNTESIRLSQGFGLSAKTTAGMFQSLTKLKYINLPSGFGRYSKDMDAMFSADSSLNHLKISPKFTTKHVDGENDGFDGIFSTDVFGGFSGKRVPRSATHAMKRYIPKKYWNSNMGGGVFSEN